MRAHTERGPRMARRVKQDFITHGMDEPMPAPDARSRNGEYKGTAPVRSLPLGVTGADLGRARQLGMRPGQVWRKGDLRVRILTVSPTWVTFRELTHTKATRKIRRDQFERAGLPEGAIADPDGEGQ